MNQKRIDNIRNRIELIHSQIVFYYNSLNVAVGPQGSGKTAFLMKQLMMLSRVQNHLYEAIIYVSMGDSDCTFETLRSHISIPIYMCNYDDFYQKFDEYVKARDPLSTLHTFIIFEDASFIFQKDSCVWNQIICRLRHLRVTMWLNVHIWKSINTSFRSQIACLFVFKGFSRMQMSNMYRQSSIQEDFAFFYGFYGHLNHHQVLKIDNINSKLTLI